ncbi:MAG: ABC transporter ATP-binding protein [Eubacteriales bacterium]|nr:ABC transporter ATP-binding protein [Eubacteriales bacterium]
MTSKFKLFTGLLKGNKLKYSVAFTAVMLADVFALVSPLVIRFTMDTVIGGMPADLPSWFLGIIKNIGGTEALSSKIWILTIVLVILAALNGMAAFIKSKYLARASESISLNIRNSLYEKLHRLPYNYYIKAQTGDLVQRCSSDVETVRRFMGVQLIEVGHVLFLAIIIISITMTLNTTLSLVSMALFPVIMLFSFIFFVKVRKLFKESDEAEGSLSAVLQENITGVRVVRAFARQGFEYEKFSEKNNTFRNLSYKLNTVFAFFWSMSDLLCTLQLSVVSILGIYMAAVGHISLGTFFVFAAYESMLIWPIRQLGRIFADMGKMTVSLERIHEVLSEPVEEMTDSGLKPEIKGNIEFKNVSFGYENSGKVLDDVTFSVKEGQTVAILGPTGSGKSTLILLLQRLYDYQEGSIKIDGAELKDIDKKWLRQKIGLILQDPFLFSKTIKENIALSKPNASDKEIFRVAKIVSIHNAIKGFEKGYNTEIGERGVTLSGGEKQRVVIARSIIRDCPVLIFDDSLSAVDTGTDAEIRRALQEKTKRVTTFIISHRITTLSQADLILVLENGKITQSGNHQELVAQKGMYQRIWELQTSMR